MLTQQDQESTHSKIKEGWYFPTLYFAGQQGLLELVSTLIHSKLANWLGSLHEPVNNCCVSPASELLCMVEDAERSPMAILKTDSISRD